MRGLPLSAWAYVCGTVAAAVALLAMSSYARLDHHVLAVLVVLFIALDSAPAKLSVERARVSMSYAAGLASVVLLGSVGAAVVGASAIITGQRLRSPVKRLFNGAQFALCGYAAGTVYSALGGLTHQPAQPHWVEYALTPFLGALVTYVVVNLLLAGGVLLLSKQAPLWGLLWASGHLAVGVLGYGVIGLLIAGLWPTLGPGVLVLVLL
ncbi:metal-dependent phosphohydrolase, partial [Actinomadura alba]|nr:metal-dependent phosphohydrolase [Actinomadura alba]